MLHDPGSLSWWELKPGECVCVTQDPPETSARPTNGWGIFNTVHVMIERKGKMWIFSAHAPTPYVVAL